MQFTEAQKLIRTYTAAGPLGGSAQAVDRLALLHELRGLIEDEIAGEVAVARVHGSSWAEVGDALHITRQSAHERYRHITG